MSISLKMGSDRRSWLRTYRRRLGNFS